MERTIPVKLIIVQKGRVLSEDVIAEILYAVNKEGGLDHATVITKRGERLAVDTGLLPSFGYYLDSGLNHK
jgi:hypothetical protein